MGERARAEGGDGQPVATLVPAVPKTKTYELSESWWTCSDRVEQAVAGVPARPTAAVFRVPAAR